MRESCDLRSLIEKGAEALSRRRLDEAEHIFNGVLRAEPSHLMARIKLAHISQEKNRLDMAHRYYEIAREVDPLNPEILFGQALLCERLGLYREAEKKYRECLDSNPSHTAAHCNLAAVLLRMGACEEARNQYEKALETDPSSFLIHRNLGAVHQQANREQEAVKAYRTALSLKPDQPDVVYDLSRMLMNLGEWEEAQALLEKLTSVRAGAREAKTRLEWLRARVEKERQARALIQEGELDRAVRIFGRMIEQNQRDLAAHVSLGDLHSYKEEHDRALNAYGEAEKIGPDRSDLHIRIATALHNLGRFEEAVPRYQRYVEACPRDLSALLHMGLALIQCGRNADSLEVFGKALRLDPKVAEVHNNMGVALKKEGRLKEAECAYREAIRRKPRYQEAHFNLANLHYEMGQYEDAARRYRRVLKINPDFCQARVNMEWIESKLKQGGEFHSEPA